MWGGRKLALGIGAETAGELGPLQLEGLRRCDAGCGGRGGMGSSAKPQIPNRCTCDLVSEQGLLGSCPCRAALAMASVLPGSPGGGQLTALGMVPDCFLRCLLLVALGVFPKVGRAGGKEICLSFHFFHSFTHSTNKLSACCMPGDILGTAHIAVNKLDTSF